MTVSVINWVYKTILCISTQTVGYDAVTQVNAGSLNLFRAHVWRSQLHWFSTRPLQHFWTWTVDSLKKKKGIKIDKKTKRKLKLCPLMYLAHWLESSESMDLWVLKGLAAIEQHIGIWRLHKAVLYLSDRRVVKAVPGLGHGVVAQSRVVTHV